MRKREVTVGKNYLNQDEVNQLNRVGNMWLDFAEQRRRLKEAEDERDITELLQWQAKLPAKDKS